MTRLDSCQHCDGFLPPGSQDCPHCGAHGPPAGRGRFSRLRSSLAGHLLQATCLAAVTVTLMACYGAPYDCYDGECYQACIDSSDCSTGERCSDRGICEWSGTCSSDSECGDGLYCDLERSTCEPDDPGGSCESTSQCDPLERCDPETRACVDAQPCDIDAVCGEGERCDLSYSVCVPCEAGQECSRQETCEGEITCAIAPPECPEGSSPGIANGCYTGTCITAADCAEMVCPTLTVEAECTARDECEAVFRGINCRDPDGGSCSEGSEGCVCERFEFAECVVATTIAP